MKWLKPALPHPPLHLESPSNNSLSQQESHACWLTAIRSQFQTTAHQDTVFANQVNRAASGVQGTSRNSIGLGSADGPLTEVDWRVAANSWDESCAITPDLLPRCIFKLFTGTWSTVAWLCMRLCGPGCLAVRPEVWRWKKVLALHKNGSVSCASCYRFITFMQQHGLLQEHILASRIISKCNALYPATNQDLCTMYLTLSTSLPRCRHYTLHLDLY